MILVNDPAKAAELRALRFYGEPDRTRSERFGVNSRLDELQAAILSAKLAYLDRWNARRREIAGRYDMLLKGADCVLPESPEENGHAYHLYVIRVKGRDAVRKRLAEKGIETLVHYPLPLHRHPVFSEWSTYSFPRAEAYAREILSLPLHPYLTDDEAAGIAEAVRSVLSSS